ncbi:MAG: GAF domain-containing protein [Polyangiaceae bacterium]|nr:GAF domain-containing protein [Polyangiaceae bacterium]
MEPAFAARLFDLLSTLEASAVIGLAKSRVRGLGEQLAFACSAMRASEAIAALETSATTHLLVPVVASPAGHREVSMELPFEGTILSHVLGGGSTYALSLEPGDDLVAPLRHLFEADPVAALVIPIRLGDRTVGATALVSHAAPFGDAEIEMAERFGEVVGLTAEAFFTERLLFELFSSCLPELLGKEAATSLPEKVMTQLRAMRVAPVYRTRLELALAIGRLTSRTSLEARLATRVLDAFEGYLAALEGGGA